MANYRGDSPYYAELRKNLGSIASFHDRQSSQLTQKVKYGSQKPTIRVIENVAGNHDKKGVPFVIITYPNGITTEKRFRTHTEFEQWLAVSYRRAY